MNVMTEYTPVTQEKQVVRPRHLRSKRGESVIYDIIDEWLAPLVAQRIAHQDPHREQNSETSFLLFHGNSV